MAPDLKESKQQAVAESDGQVADDRLREAREAQGLSVDAAALELRLDRSIVLALEAGDYAGLGAPVFVRGYLRSYARLLGLPEDDIAATYEDREFEPEEFRTRSMTTEVKAGANFISFFMWVGLALVVIVGLLYVLIADEEPVAEPERPAFVAPEQAPESVPAVIESEPEPEPEPEPEREPEPETEPVASTAAPAVPPVQAEPPRAELATEAQVVAPAPAAAAQEVTLVFRFNEDCWAEISDSRKRLIYGLEQAGRVRTVRGVPPFKLFLGNAGAVELMLDGNAYDVAGRVRRGSNTARFSIDAAELAAFRNAES